MILDPTAELGIRVAAALFFLWAGVAKARDWTRFCAALAEYRLVPAFAITPAALAVPAAELGVAATLPCVALRPWPEIAGAALLFVFAGAMTINLLRDRSDIACGCSFGAKENGLHWSFVARNVAAAAALIASGVTPLPTSPLQVATGIIAGFALLALLTAADAVWALFARHPLPAGKAT
ncbi:MAG TPA: MauE/DoxX family redox-associated membrane protein [Rhizomicrobium sp.]|nr:MauE/DoxX family redox-associated membrane protein [Rhizomicrobium sp.]